MIKYYETHYNEYVSACKKENLQLKLPNMYEKMGKTIEEMNNIIFYGPAGTGKYSQVLNYLTEFSPTQLKYEKKATVIYDKQEYYLKISDIHYEIDMSILGCNSKLLWHEIYLQIMDIISSKTHKAGIIVCKHFQEVHNELLDIFYSYIQSLELFRENCIIRFILITEQLSFIPDNILNNCHLIHIKRPTKSSYQKIAKMITKSKDVGDISFTTASFLLDNKNNYTDLENITNIKLLYLPFTTHCFDEIYTYNNDQHHLFSLNEQSLLKVNDHKINAVSNNSQIMMNRIMIKHKIICDKIIHVLFTQIISNSNSNSNKKIFNFSIFRTLLYEILIYHLDINECIWYILYTLLYNTTYSSVITNKQLIISKILLKTYQFFRYYNNNYRPIYHLESYLLELAYLLKH